MSAIPEVLQPTDCGDESRHIVLVDKPTSQGKYDQKFARAFIHMVENPDDKGLMSTHLFYDIPRDRGQAFSQLSYDARSILSGGSAWERRIEESVSGQDNGGFWSKDNSVVAYALQNGLLDKLPKGFVKFVSYGGGDVHAFSGNELQVIGAVYDQRKEDIVEFCAVDILERFAFNCAIAARNAYGLRSQGVLGDFIYNGRLAIPDTKGTAVVMIFGGPFENTPVVKDGPSPQDTTALAWAKLNIQHGLNTVVVKTFDTNQTPDLENGPYAPRKHFEAFLLSAFARATQQGIIKDPQYDVFEHWRMVSQFNDDLKSVELHATCKEDHDVVIGNRTREFKKGESRVITLSHKWDEATQVSIAHRAGFETEIFCEPGNDNLLMVATAVRKPDADLMAQVFPR